MIAPSACIACAASFGQNGAARRRTSACAAKAIGHAHQPPSSNGLASSAASIAAATKTIGACASAVQAISGQSRRRPSAAYSSATALAAASATASAKPHRHERIDLDRRGHDEPHRRRRDQQRLARFLARLEGAGAAGAMDEEGAGERCRGGHQAVEEIGVEDQRRHAVALVAEQHRQAGEAEQQVAEQARQAALLAKADPDQAGAFERPGAGGAALVERERDDEGEEDRRDRQRRIEGDAELGAPLHPGREHHVEAGEGERRERGAVRHLADQPVLEREGHRRQAEQQAAVDPRVAVRRGRARGGRGARRAGAPAGRG